MKTVHFHIKTLKIDNKDRHYQGICVIYSREINSMKNINWIRKQVNLKRNLFPKNQKN